MKSNQHQEDKWQRNLLSDLDYIKMHLRYPWKNGMKAPLYVAATFIAVYIALLLVDRLWATAKNDFIHFFLPLSALALAILSIIHYLNSLRFTAIETGLGKNLNRQLLFSFLLKKQLLSYEHPQCPDIIQILSRPVNINSEQREVLVFIATENRILVNSHFTENHWIILLKKRHDKSMARALGEYIADSKKQSKADTKRYGQS